MRLRSDIWVSAYIRRVNLEGAFAALQRRGAAEAGAICITVEGPDRTFDLYVPAPQSLVADDVTDRRFRRHPASAPLDAPAIAAILERETRFDPDIWIVAVEDRGRRSFLEDVVDGDA